MDSSADGRSHMTRLKWIPGDRLTVIHAARNYIAGVESVDVSAHRLISDSLGDLYDRLLAAEIDMTVFWRRLQCAVASGDDDQSACTSALLAAGCSPLASDQVASAITSKLTDLRLSYQQRQPKLAEQLTLRVATTARAVGWLWRRTCETDRKTHARVVLAQVGHGTIALALLRWRRRTRRWFESIVDRSGACQPSASVA